MRRTCYAIPLLLIVLPATLHAQHAAAACRLEISYDREADITTVECELLESDEAPARLTVQSIASFHGKEPNETATFRLGFSAYKGGATRRTQPLFKEATTLSLLVDSARLEVPITGYRKDFYELNRLLSEQARAEISREDLKKLLDARSLTGKWGDAEFKISGATLVSLKNFISRHIFVTSDR